jgi:putative PEP-CTERM system TPR-repeat lipoprotein
MPLNPLPVAGRLAAVVFCSVLALAGCGRDTPRSLIASGNDFLAKKDSRSAVIQFKAALQADPGSAEARYLLGRALLESGDPNSAIVELTKSMDQRYDDNKVMPLLARALLLSGGAKKLTTLYGDVVLTDKTANASLKSSVATAWGALGESAKAQTALGAAIASVADYPGALILQARLKASEGHYDIALASVDQVLARDGKNYEAWQLKGEILEAGKNDAKGAESAYRQALAAEPAFVPAHLALITQAVKAGNIVAAKAQADRLRAVLPRHPQTLFVDARLALFDNDLKKARELTQQLLRIAPENVGVLQVAGTIEAQEGALLVAETQFTKALQYDPTLLLARRSLAKIYLRQGRPTKALSTLEPLIGPSGNDPEALSLAGESQLQLGDARAAEGLFLQAAKLKPDDPGLRTALALMKLSRGDAESAFAQLEKISAETQGNATDLAIVSARMKRQEYDAALRTIDLMAKKTPKDASVFEYRGMVQNARKDYPAARAAFEQALALDPARFSATANLASLDAMEGKGDLARKRLQAAVNADPRNFNARMALADMMQRQGAPLNDVKAAMVAGIQAAPTEAAPRLQLIDLLLQRKLFKEGLAVAQEASAAMPNDTEVLDALGRAQLLAGDTQQATSTFRRVANLDTRSAKPHLRLADLMRSIGNRDGAIASLQRALEIEPNLEAAQSRLMDLLVIDGRPKQALEMAHAMQLRAPTSASGYLFEGAIHRRLKAMDTAMAVYRLGLVKAAEKSDLAVELHKTLIAAGHTAEATQFATTWLKNNPDDVGFEYQVASIAILQGDLNRAETGLKHVISLRPNHALALNNLGWVLAMQGKSGAVAYAQKALDLLPNRPSVMDTLAMALASDKQYAKSLELQKKVVEIAPGDMGMHLNLAKIAIEAGDKALARSELERLAALGSKLPFQAEVARLQKSL